MVRIESLKQDFFRSWLLSYVNSFEAKAEKQVEWKIQSRTIEGASKGQQLHGQLFIVSRVLSCSPRGLITETHFTAHSCECLQFKKDAGKCCMVAFAESNSYCCTLELLSDIKPPAANIRLNPVRNSPMNKDKQDLYISVDLLRNRITNRLILLLFIVLLINTLLSLARIPVMGIQPFMVLHAFLLGAIAILYFGRKRIQPDTTALVMVGVLSMLLISGVASLGLLSATFVVGPVISLYLMLLGHRRSAYTSVVAVLLYLSVVAFLFVSGSMETPTSPNLYAHSSIAWIVMITAVVGVSAAFIAPFELVPGVLQSSEERFRLAFENANVGICLTSLEGRLLKVNTALCEMLGYERGELEQMNVADMTYGDDREASLDFIEHAPGGGAEKINFEKRYICKRGDVIWANVASSLLHDSRGTPQYFITHIQNITERKSTEGALRESEESYRALVTLSTDAIYVHVDTRITFVNPAMCKLLGAENPLQLIDKSIFEIVHPDDHQKMRERWNLVFSGQRAPLLEETFVRLDGTLVDVEANSVAIDWQGSKGVQVIVRDITKRKHAEEALRESEARYRTLVENSPDIIASFDKEGRYLFVNSSIATASPLKPQEFIGKTTHEVTFSEAQAILSENAIRSVFETHIPFESEFEFEGVRGKAIYDWRVYPVLDSAGNVLSVFSISRNITARKRAEVALQESEQLYKALVSASPDGVTVTDLSGKAVFVSEKTVNLFGEDSQESILGRSILDWVAPEDRSRAIDNIRRILEGAVLPGSEYQMTRKDGSRFIGEVNSALLRGPKNETRGLVSFARDITERKQAETALRKSEEQFHKIFHASPAPMSISTLTDGIYIDINESFLKHMELERDEVIGKTAIHLNTWADENERTLAVTILRERGALRDFEAKHRTKSGKIGNSIASAEIIDLDGVPCILSVTLDITERKLAEEALRVSMEQLHALEGRLENIREEERKSVSREVHDELGQVLTALKIDLMSLKKLDLTDRNVFGIKLESMLGLTASAIKSVQNISSKLRPGMLDDLGLVAAFEWQIEDFQKRTGIACTFILPESEPSIDTQASTAIFRILQETLTNIARHAHARKVTIVLAESENEVSLSVEDDGVGISASKIDDPKSFGLLGIRERLRPYGGSFIIQRVKEGGTQASIRLRKQPFLPILL